MANYFVPLQAPRPRNAMLDLSPINQGLDSISQANQQAKRNAMLQQSQDLQQREFDARQAQMTRQNDRQDREMYGKQAQAVDQEQDPQRRAALWNRITSSFDQSKLSPEERDPITGPKLMMAQAGLVVDPLERQTKQAQLGLIQAQTAAANRRASGPVSAQERAALAQQYGLREGTPEYQQYVLTGNIPARGNTMNPTVQKELFEADQMTAANQSVIGALTSAKELSKKAYGGFGASAAGYLASQVGMESGDKTIELQNLITNQALESLRAVFGGNPTEGERKILLDVAGSVGQTDAVRQAIYDRAISAANNRLKLNQEKARALRTGEYFQSGYNPQPSGGPAVGAVQDGYKFKGGDPANPASWEKQ